MLYAFIMTLSFMVGCGGSETIIEKQVPSPHQPPNPGPTVPPGGGGGGGGNGAVSFAGTIKPMLNKFCSQSGCHAGAAFVQTEAAFLNSRSKQRVGNGTMPPQYSPNYNQFTQKEKALFSTYFDRN